MRIIISIIRDLMYLLIWLGLKDRFIVEKVWILKWIIMIRMEISVRIMLMWLRVIWILFIFFCNNVVFFLCLNDIDFILIFFLFGKVVLNVIIEGVVGDRVFFMCICVWGLIVIIIILLDLLIMWVLVKVKGLVVLGIIFFWFVKVDLFIKSLFCCIIILLVGIRVLMFNWYKFLIIMFLVRILIIFLFWMILILCFLLILESRLWKLFFFR